MPLDFAGPWRPEADVPQVGFKEPPDHHEAYWLYGYDPAVRVVDYLYLAAEKDAPLPLHRRQRPGDLPGRAGRAHRDRSVAGAGRDHRRDHGRLGPHRRDVVPGGDDPP